MNWLIIAIIVCIGVLFCFLLAIANHSGERFAERYQQMNKIELEKGITPLDFANSVNQKYFGGKLQILQIGRVMADAYSKGRLFLSGQTISINSIASFTIIAHELGHAYQDKTGKKLKTLIALRMLGKALGIFMMPLLLAGLVLFVVGEEYLVLSLCLIGAGVLIFILALVIKLRTISIEKDSSDKAIMFLEEIAMERELKLCKQFLVDARLTYWADFLRICFGWTFMTKKTKMFN